jgi:uncharacterized protein (DUF58 family)
VSLVSRLLDPTLVEHLNHMQVSARSVVQGSTIGQHRSPVKGASVEFRQHRFYVPGDEPRRLDWRVLARTDRPYVKEYDEETNLRCVIALDTSGSMAYEGQHGSKFDYATRLAAALSYLMLSQAESVGIAICGQETGPFVVPHSSTHQLARIIDALEMAAPAGPSGIARAIHDIADQMERRSLVIVLSDFFLPIEDLRKSLAHLRHERHEVLAIQVVDRHEEEFPFQTWCRFRGLEGEPPRVIEPAMARRVYLEGFRRHRRLLLEAALGLRVEFQEIVTDRPLLDAIRLVLSRHNQRQAHQM